MKEIDKQFDINPKHGTESELFSSQTRLKEANEHEQLVNKDVAQAAGKKEEKADGQLGLAGAVGEDGDRQVTERMVQANQSSIDSSASVHKTS